MNYNIMYAVALVLTFLGTVLISKKLIPILKSHKMGQKILEIGPRWHKSKEGTPTMGGIAFIIPSVIVGMAGSVYLGITDGIRESLPQCRRFRKRLWECRTFSSDFSRKPCFLQL